MIDIVRKASEAVGSVTALALQLKIKPQAIHQWVRVPAERVLAIEKATGGAVTRHDMRPDLYPEPPATEAAE